MSLSRRINKLEESLPKSNQDGRTPEERRLFDQLIGMLSTDLLEIIVKDEDAGEFRRAYIVFDAFMVCIHAHLQDGIPLELPEKALRKFLASKGSPANTPLRDDPDKPRERIRGRHYGY